MRARRRGEFIRGSAALLVSASLALSAFAAEKLPAWPELRRVQQAALNHDGTRLVAQLADQRLGFWDVATGALLASDPAWPAFTNVTLSADATRVVASSEKGVQVFDATTGAALSPLLASPLRDPHYPQLALSPDGTTLVAFEEKALAVFEVASGRRVATLALSEGVGEEGITPFAQFSKDGVSCFVMGATGVITRYEVKTWQPLGKPFRHPPAESAYAFGFAIGDDARWLATFDNPGENGPRGQLQMWEVATARALGKPVSAVNGLEASFIPGTDRVLLAPGRGPAEVRTLPAMKKAYEVRAHDDVDGPHTALSPDGQWLLTWGPDRLLFLIETATGAIKTPRAFQASITSVHPLPDSRGCLVVFDNTAFLAEDHHDHYLMRLDFAGLETRAMLRLTESLHTVTLSPDGRRTVAVVGRSEATRVQIFDTQTLRPIAP